MSKIDRIKEELAWLKVVFGVFAVTDVSLVAWLAQNFSYIDGVRIHRRCFGNRHRRLGQPGCDQAIQTTGEGIMVWFVVAALAVLLTGMGIIAYDLADTGR